MASIFKADMRNNPDPWAGEGINLEDSPYAFTKSNNLTLVDSTGPTDSNGVAIQEEFADIAIGKLNFFFTSTIDLQQRTKSFPLCARNSTRSKEITGVHRAATDSVVSKHLWERPQKVCCGGLGNCRSCAVGCLNGQLETGIK